MTLVVCGVAHAFGKPDGSTLSVHSVVVNAQTIPRFLKHGGAGDRFGRLRFLSGLALSSSDPAFGGFSGLEISMDGEALFTVSDAGAWLKARLVYRDNRLVAIEGGRIGAISALLDKKLRRGRDQDAEAVRLYSGDFEKGVLLIGFEANQRIGFFDIFKGELKPPLRYLRPPVKLSSNKGIEAVTVIREGRLKGAVVAFAERSLDSNGQHRGWLWRVNPTGKRSSGQTMVSPDRTAAAISLTNIGGFDVTDAATGTDGYLYILERRFRWSEGVKMRIRRVKIDDLQASAILSGETLVEADYGSEIDNMEGLAVHRDRLNRTILTVISDNNFNPFLQRNLLLQFELVGQMNSRNQKPRDP